MFAHGSASLQPFLVVWIFLRSRGVICYDRWVLREVHKNYFKDWINDIFQLPQDQIIQLEIPNIEKLTNQKPFLIIWKYWYLIYINMHPLKTSQVNSLPYYVFARLSLRKKCPNTELFLVRIFLYSVPIQKNTDQK